MPLNGSTEAESVYLSLNTRPCPGEYHWGLVLTDSNTEAVLHHASNRGGPWVYEERDVKPGQSLTLIVLVRVDKFKSHSRALDVISGIPTDGSPSQRTGEAFSCRTWVMDVLAALHEHGEIRLPEDLAGLERTAVELGLEFAPVAEGGDGATVINDPFNGVAA